MMRRRCWELEPNISVPAAAVTLPTFMCGQGNSVQCVVLADQLRKRKSSWSSPDPSAGFYAQAGSDAESIQEIERQAE